ncbi:MAG TPA: imidazole glycerol phosphate synthase subunit HisH [Bacteroidales bacterium]|mgnify:CR=1 FL=1|nr:imidazole glycerol phosphate synthase subunit HisH [Bacteroidales bacterium]
MPQTIAIVDYKMGNIHSVYKKMLHITSNIIVTNSAEEIAKADKIILPGVGHFAKAMKQIHELGIFNTLHEHVSIKQKPILGICLGMQLFANTSEEGNVPGFGWIDAHVKRFEISNTLQYKTPHTGWNEAFLVKDSNIMNNIEENTPFYFVHSYHYICNHQQDILLQTEYEYLFTSAVEKNNIFGVQFHPEKSHENGTKLLRNFVKI